MLRDITLGQYYQADSVIHRLDPRVKLVATIGFIISLFVVDSWIGYVGSGHISGIYDKTVKGALSLYGKGNEGHCVYFDDYGGI